eukprot:CAMPEP_0114577312 /NCGR_PEP_ID=MMETSP0125-20121206/1987_1 /TAXON_ID=485358 ORGANISM="Aristerostoma sp., Strain ATCC 50986" /NCGR_SAMPLE_ID=MMETSP0125 /ASSEMBLY_ACC=CAM_ASM_000245 /LENGTH=108 /DNA_ID=CAMNT_0001766527 /DNA_START=337 /DNA_END=663 /DNA_ORIENTATION=-
MEIEKHCPELGNAIIKAELMLCETMLGRDERNFHVWNYRNWIVNSIKGPENDTVLKELKFLDQKLEQNFSNFSALHFKSKNLVSKYSLLVQKNADKKFENIEDMETLK